MVFSRLKTPLVLGLLLGCAGSEDSPRAKLGNVEFQAAEVLTPVAQIASPDGHGNVAMVGGYLMVIYSSDAGGTASDGGIEFWDISDPRSPRLAASYDDADTHGLREPHGFGFARVNGRRYLCAQGIEGIQFWDVQDPLAIRLASYLHLPGIGQGNYAGDWWVAWQAPFVFVAGRGSGLYVVDARDPSDPILARHLPSSDLGGVGAAVLHAIGNLLIVSASPNGHMLTMDMSDPIAPQPIQLLGGLRGYSHTFASGMLLNAGGQGDPEQLHVTYVGADGTLTPGNSVGTALGDGGYGSYQDGFLHAGFSDRYVKFDLSNEQVVATASGGLPSADEDFAVVLGNLVFVGNDHHGGSALVPHQAAPDTTGPAVEWVHPPDGASSQALTSRVGLFLSDLVDLDSVDARTFQVFAPGEPPLAGWYSVQGGIVNFCPLTPLEENTDYTVEVAGIRDVAGNPGPHFTSSFRTGAQHVGPAAAPALSIRSFGADLVGAPIDFDVDITNGASVDTYVWDFGDGSPPSAPASYPGTSHMYAGPGRYTVMLRATNAHGTGSAAAVQIVHHPPTSQAPTSSSTVIAAGGRVINVNPDNDTVSAIDAVGLNKLWEAPVADDPRSLALAPDGSVWVVCRGDASLVRLDAASGASLGSAALPRGSRPTGIVFAPNESDALVTLPGTGQVARVSASGILLTTADLGGRPHGIAVVGDSGRVLVTDFLADAGGARVHELSLATLSFVQSIPLADDPGPDTESGGRGRPNYLAAVVPTPDGRGAWIPSKKDNLFRGLWRDGLPLDFETSTRSIVSKLDLVAGAEDHAARIDTNDRGVPSSVLFSPTGDLLFVAHLTNGHIESYDAVTGDLVASLTVGHGPAGMAFDSSTQRLFVHEFLERSVAAFDVADLISGEANSATLVGRTSVVATEALAPDVLQGKQLFYEARDGRLSQDGYVSCAACHIDGEADGSVWDFTQEGEGLRNTISLSGRAGLGHGRLHWTANFDEVQDFEGVLRGLAGGTGLLTDPEFASTSDPLGPPKVGLSTELDALAAYVSSLDSFPPSPHRTQAGALTPAAAAGATVFTAQGCAVCHPSPNYTDGLRHDVGTITPASGMGSGASLVGVGFETPTLRGVWDSAPYFHDGSAPTLQAVLVGGHGGASLTATETTELVQFLLQLE